MDEFKKYLRNHRDELDVEGLPSQEVWQRIQQATPAGKPVLQMFLKLTAAACIVALAGFGAYKFWFGPKPTGPSIVSSQPATRENAPSVTPDTAESHAAPNVPNSLAVIEKTKEPKVSTKAIHRSNRRKKGVPEQQELSPVETLEKDYAA